jgi:hypothetical protein
VIGRLLQNRNLGNLASKDAPNFCPRGGNYCHCCCNVLLWNVRLKKETTCFFCVVDLSLKRPNFGKFFKNLDLKMWFDET